MELNLVELLNNFGFPVLIALILLYDKMKTNGSLKESVDNNTQAIEKLYIVVESLLNNGKR